MVGQWIRDSERINAAFDCRFVNLLASKHVDETGKITLSKLWGFAGVVGRLCRLLFQQKPAICYFALTVTGAAFYRDVVLVFLLRLRGVRMVYHLHNKGIAQAAQRNFNRCLYRYVFRRSTVIVLAEQLKADLKGIVAEHQLKVCANGIPENSYSLDISRTNAIPRILFLSNLIESKGLYVLLDALALLKQKKVAFSAVLVGGEGDISANILHIRLREMQLEEEVSYAGRKYDKEKATILAHSDMLAFPSYYSKECFPLVLLEAMQSALPVVSTYEGGIPDIVDDGVTGFLVPQRDASALADKLELLLNDKELRQRMGEAGRKKYASHYTLDRFETRLMEIMREAVETNEK